MGEKVAAIVVAYKNKNDLAACYAQLRGSPEVRTIVLVDNSYNQVGSCIDYAGIRDVDDRIQHVLAEDNLGYAAGNNLGIAAARQAGVDYVLVCNPDVLIEDSTVKSLLDEMHERGLDLISPRLLEEGPAGTSRTLCNPGWDSYLGRGVVEIPHSRSTTRYVPTFYGACFLATLRIFNDVGELSEDFFLYGEEIDYTLRVNNSRFSWAVSKRHVVSHGRGSSISPGSNSKSQLSFFHSARSAVIVGRKYWPWALLRWIIGRSLLAGYLALRGRARESQAIIGGLIHGLRAPLSTDL